MYLTGRGFLSDLYHHEALGLVDELYIELHFEWGKRQKPLLRQANTMLDLWTYDWEHQDHSMGTQIGRGQTFPAFPRHNCPRYAWGTIYAHLHHSCCNALASRSGAQIAYLLILCGCLDGQLCDPVWQASSLTCCGRCGTAALPCMPGPEEKGLRVHCACPQPL